MLNWIVAVVGDMPDLLEACRRRGMRGFQIWRTVEVLAFSCNVGLVSLTGATGLGDVPFDDDNDDDEEEDSEDDDDDDVLPGDDEFGADDDDDDESDLDDDPDP